MFSRHGPRLWTMPPRQGHRKSRTGCQRCKRRKVKCDEKRPTCTGCLRYPNNCVYEFTQAPISSDHSTTESEGSALKSTASTPSSDPAKGFSTPYSDIPIDEIEPDRRRILELLLLHHFETSTVQTFPSWRFPRASRKVCKNDENLPASSSCLLEQYLAPCCSLV